MSDEQSDVFDLNSLNDEELIEQVHDDLYNGLKDEVVEATNIFLRRGWGAVVANGHIDDLVRGARSGVGHAQPPFYFSNAGNGTFRDETASLGPDFGQPRVARGLACGDFDRDGDVDLLMTTNNGPAVLLRNDVPSGNRSLRLRLVGTRSNRDGIGARVRVFHGTTVQTRVVKSGSSYLSQSELALTFGLARQERAERVVIDWPSGRTEEFKDVAAGRSFVCTEARGLTPD